MQCVKEHCKPLIAGSTQSSQLCDLRRKFMRLQLIDSTFANSSGRQFWWRRTSPSTDTNQRNFWLRPPCQIAAERSPAKLAIGLINHELSRLAGNCSITRGDYAWAAAVVVMRGGRKGMRPAWAMRSLR